MVKVSPVGDIPPLQADGSHVLIVYNTHYTDTEQVGDDNHYCQLDCLIDDLFWPNIRRLYFLAAILK